jgi:segregation and condensation protein A
MTYQIKLEKFEGPIQLLLELIEKEKLEITELSLARVTDQYLEHIRSNENIHLENLADFLSVASRLILIKSRALLPSLTFDDDEEEEIRDLARQLEEYKKFKLASIKLGSMASRFRVACSREGYLGVRSVFYPPEDVNAYDLKKYFQKILDEIPVIEKLQEELVLEVITLEEKIADLEQTMRKKIETSFSDIVANAKDKIEVIVSFLAMLEMVKQRIIQVEQKDLFKDIKLSIKEN